MSRVSTINYGGNSILFLDFTNITSPEVPGMLAEARAVIDRAAPASLRIMSDFTDAKYDAQTTEEVKKFSAANKPYVKASAVVGITGLKKVIFTGIIKATGRKMQLCATQDEAKTWLASQ